MAETMVMTGGSRGRTNRVYFGGRKVTVRGAGGVESALVPSPAVGAMA